MPTRVVASPPPKRPRPMTRNSFSANDGSLLRKTVEPLALPQGERDRERIGPRTAEEHERDEDEPAELIPVGRDAGGEPDRPERRHRLEEHLPERVRAVRHENERPGDDRHGG